MKVTIKLGRIKNNIYDIQVPYWFSSLKDIYLSVAEGYKTSVEIDLDTIDPRTIVELKIGLLNKSIVIDAPTVELKQQAWDRIVSFGTVIPEEVTEKAASKDKIAELKANRYKLEATDLLKKTTAQLAKVVGPAGLENGAVLKGIDDIVLLNTMLELEEAQQYPRKGVVSSIKGRIEALKTADISNTEKNESVPEIVEEVEEIDLDTNNTITVE